MNVAAWIAVGLFALWVLLPPWRALPVCPPASTAVAAPAPVETSDALEERLTRQLCDREVDALLHSHELVEVERAVAIVARVNCGIERRL